MKFPEVKFTPDRTKFILDECSGKTVLHLGFADSIHYQAALREDRHLHQSLLSIADNINDIFGIDIDAESVNYFRNLWMNDNLLVGNAERLDDLPIDRTFDVILAGELIEHLNNPGLFLQGVQRFMTPSSSLLITTPNALGLKFWAHALVRRDRSHPDHTVMFSFSSLTTLLMRHNLVAKSWATSMEVFSQPRNRITRPILRRLLAVQPHLAETVIVKARLAQP